MGRKGPPSRLEVAGEGAACPPLLLPLFLHLAHPGHKGTHALHTCPPSLALALGGGVGRKQSSPTAVEPHPAQAKHPLSTLGTFETLDMGSVPILQMKKQRPCVQWPFLSSSDGKESACDAGDTGSIPGSGRSPGGGNGNPTPIFLPGESHGQRSLVGYSPEGRKEADTTATDSFTFASLRRGERQG